MSSKLGRPLGRPRWRASLLGHPGTSPERGGTVFLLPPAPPPPRTALGCGGLLTLTLRGKAMDGFEEQQERNRPQLCPPSLGNRRTDAGFPQASTGRRRSVAGRSLGLSLSQRTEHTIDRRQTLATQATRPLDRGRSTYPSRVHPPIECRPNTGDKLRSSDLARLRQLHLLVGPLVASRRYGSQLGSTGVRVPPGTRYSSFESIARKSWPGQPSHAR